MSFETRAMVMREPGAVEVLEERALSLDWPAGDNDVLVRLRAAGVNPADVFFRQLGPYVGDGRGCVLGHDGAGVVEAVGSGVTTLRVGDEVCFCHGGIGAVPGTYARHAVVPEGVLAGKPANLDFVQAAALPLVFITAWEALAERAQVRPGDFVLVHAGAGGTGHIAIQVARLLGGRVATTVSTEEKAALVRELGAERPILYKVEDIVGACRNWTDGRGVDVALDNVGAEVMQRTFTAMAIYGRVVTLMGTPADTEALDAYNSNLSIHNVMMLTPMWREMHARVLAQADIVRRGIGLLSDGEIKVHVARTFDLSEVADAHRLMEAGGGSGKLVLTIGD